jgi:hypothetical protein
MDNELQENNEIKTKRKRRINYKERIRSYRLSRLYRAILFLLVIVGLSAILYLQWRDRVYSESVLISSAELRLFSGTTIKNLAGYVLQYSKDGISLTDSKGVAVWNQTYEMQDPRIAICLDVVAIADYNGSTIYIMDTQRKLGEINTNLPIRAFDVAANGQVLVVLEDGNTTWVNMYAADGTQIASNRTSMNDSGYPISISVSPNGKLVGISFLNVADGNARTSVAFYNFGPVGQNANNYMSGYNYSNAVAPYLKFMSDDAAFAVTDDRIMFYAGNEKPMSVADTLLDEKVRSVYSSEDYVGLVFHATSGEALYRLDIYDKRGTLLLSKEFDFDYTEVAFVKDSFIIYNELDLLICHINGTEKYNGFLEKVTALFIPTNSLNRYVVVTSESIDTVEFR